MSARLFKAGHDVRAVPLSFLISTEVSGDSEPPPQTPAQSRHAPERPATVSPVPHAAVTPATEPADAVHEAQAIVERARAEALEIEEEARQQAAHFEREARERGLREARVHFDEAVADAVRPWREQLADSVAEVATLRARVAARVESELVRLALEIARKVVHREVNLDHEIALTLVRVALSRVNSRALARVRLNPADCAFVESRLAQLGSAGTVELLEDHTVGRGGCVVETETGDIDARIEQQFAEIERGLMTN